MTEEKIAHELLLRLLKAGNKASAGVRQHIPALTASQIKSYSAIRNWHQKQQCEEVFLAARDTGAISFVRDKLNPVDGLIERIDLVDTGALARFLKPPPHADIIVKAKSLIAPYLGQHDVLEEVIEKWSRMANVRGKGPSDVSALIENRPILPIEN